MANVNVHLHSVTLFEGKLDIWKQSVMARKKCSI